MKFRLQTRSQNRTGASLRSARGSVMLVLIFMMAVIAIALAVAAPRMLQAIQRDRETEMIHRGEQYARAIKRYYKKFGRYPTRIEDLEDTNKMRFLRKRYKDPMSADGKWRLVRYGEVQLGQGAGAGGGLGTVPTTPAGGLGQPAGGLGTPSGGFGQPSTFGQPSGDSGSSGSGLFSDSNKGDSGSGPASSLFGSSGSGSSSLTGATGSGTTGGTGGPSGGVGGTGSGLSSASGSQTFGGGAFLGVASMSEKKGVHEFNGKKQYNQWLFVYDPNQDRGQLLKGPYNPKAYFGQFGQQPQGQPVGQPAGGLGGPGTGLGGSGLGGQPNPTPQPPTTNPSPQ